MKNTSKRKFNKKKEKSNMKSNYNWQIHSIKNGCKCENDYDYIFDMIPGAANFYTHGLEQYDHPDFQLVLDYELETAADILNALGERVRNGEKFNAGDYVKGIFEDCDVRLDVFEESGRDVLRVIVPDSNNIFPDEEGCSSSFCHQMLPTEELYIKHYIETCVRTAFILELNGDFYVEILMNGDKVECYLGSKKVGIKSYMHDISESDFIDGKILIDKITECIRYYKTSYLNQDEKDDTEEYHFIQRFNQTIYSFDIGEGFIVDVCNFKNGLAFYLYHRDCSIKAMMYTWYADTKINYDIWANIENYKSVYSDDFMGMLNFFDELMMCYLLDKLCN